MEDIAPDVAGTTRRVREGGIRDSMEIIGAVDFNVNISMTDAVDPPDAAYDGPTFEDLAIAEELSDVDRIAIYSASHIALQRLVHVKMISSVAREVGVDETTSKIVPLLPVMALDDEFIVRQHVALETGALISFYAAEYAERRDESLYMVVLSALVPVVGDLLHDDHAEVREAAAETLQAACSLIRSEHVLDHVFVRVLALAHDLENENRRVTASLCFERLATAFGPDLCKRFVLSEIVALGEDPVFRVRKSVVSALPKLARVFIGDPHSREIVFGVFADLCKDPLWGVRKACCSCLVDMTTSVMCLVDDDDFEEMEKLRVKRIVIDPVLTQHTRFLSPKRSRWRKQRDGLVDAEPDAKSQLRDSLSETLDLFLNDSSRWVVSVAQSAVGPYISTFDPSSEMHKIPPEFVSRFYKGAYADNRAESRFECAFSFAAVVHVVGRSAWTAGGAQSCFVALAHDPTVKPRKALAHSAHELASTLGPGITRSDILPALSEWCAAEDVVKEGALLSLPGVFDVVLSASDSTPDEHVRLASLLVSAHASSAAPSQWRVRRILALTLEKHALRFALEVALGPIADVVFAGLADDFSAVKDCVVPATCAVLGRAVQAYESNTCVDLADKCFKRLLAMAARPSFAERQTFVRVVASLLHALGPALITPGVPKIRALRTAVMNTTLALTEDAVPNVRISLAKALVAAPDWAKKELGASAELLGRDADKDVRGALSMR